MLLDEIPDLEMSGRARIPVAGEVPDPIDPPTGCTFHPRCPHANERCRSEAPLATAIHETATYAENSLSTRPGRPASAWAPDSSATFTPLTQTP